MDQQKIDAIAQAILSMSAEERQLLDKTVSDLSSQPTEPAEADKSLRIAEIAQQMQAFEDKYNAPMSASPLGGPEDGARNGDAYLYDLSQVQDDSRSF